MAKFQDLTGANFGRLTVISYRGKNRNGKSVWLCHCSCGNATSAEISQLNAGKVTSCGCLARDLAKSRTAKVMKSHGHSAKGIRSPEYNAWRHMNQRCSNPDYKQWKDYGGRGISVCPEWRESFEAFLDDVGPRPSPELTLDRIQNDGNYEPGNVRWADRTIQSQNRRNYKGK
jgi:hypothetical protein